MHDRRTKPRMLCADLVEITYQTPEGIEQQITANLEDISNTGVCLQTEEEVPVGTRLEIKHSRGQFSGEVRYCKYSEPVGYFIGVEFAGDSQWTRRQFKPMHMLDPRRLVERSLGRANKSAS
jgi:hypothetical protein